MSDHRHSAAGPLRSRRACRTAVALVVATTALLGSLLPTSYHGFAILAVLLLIGLDVVLIQATAGLAFTRRRALDERERALRDLAYRRGFRLLGLAMVLEVVVLIATDILAFYLGGGALAGLGLNAVDNGITGRALVALLELLVMMPTMVIAWVDGDRDEDEVLHAARRGWLAWLTLPAVALAWLILVAVGPEQVAAASRNSSLHSLQGASCSHFAGGRIVGAQFGATVGMRVEVCWNGRDAFVVGDPSIPLPQSAIDGIEAPVPPSERASLPTDLNPAQPDITACGSDNLDDFATVSVTRCAGVIDDAGTLHYSVRARVAGPFGIGQRDVTLTLVVDRNGRVLEQP